MPICARWRKRAGGRSTSQYSKILGMKFCFQMLTAACVFAAFTASSIAQSSALASDPVYDKNCAKCHGKSAEGRHFGGPSLVKNAMSEDELKAIITNGKGHMPKFAG